MEINKLSQAVKVESYEVNTNKKINDSNEQHTLNKAQQDKVEISKEALEAASSNKEQKKDTTNILKMTAEERAQLVSQLKEEMAKSQSKFFDFVRDTLAGQGQVLADSDEIWRFIASGNYEVDEATKADAQKAIADDGFYGVNQVSTRIFDFALALTGGDTEKMKRMEAAFEEGFKEATKSWGKELPEISQETFKALKEKFANYYQE